MLRSRKSCSSGGKYIVRCDGITLKANEKRYLTCAEFLKCWWAIPEPHLEPLDFWHYSSQVPEHVGLGICWRWQPVRLYGSGWRLGSGSRRSWQPVRMYGSGWRLGCCIESYGRRSLVSNFNVVSIFNAEMWELSMIALLMVEYFVTNSFLSQKSRG